MANGPHYNENRTILADVIPLKTPYTIQCEVSQFCNLKCNYCMQSFTKNEGKRLMHRDTFSRLCTQIGEFDGKLKQVNFSGWGEPLLNPWLSEMIARLKECNVTENIAIVTNGLLLVPRTSMSLIASGVDHIRISLQGMTSDRYFEVSGSRPDFAKLVENVKFLYERKGRCQVSVKLADTVMDEEEERLFHDIFDPISDRAYIEYIRPVFKENRLEDGKFTSKFGDNHPPVIACSQPFFMMSVTATGDILPCCSYYDPAKLGNMKEIALKNVWDGDLLKVLQRMLLNGDRKKQGLYPVCQKCMVPDVVMMPEDNLDGREEEIRRRL